MDQVYALPSHFSEFEYSSIMASGYWLEGLIGKGVRSYHLPGSWFIGCEPDAVLNFIDKYDAHCFVMRYLIDGYNPFR